MRLVTVFRAHGHPGRHIKTTATTRDDYYTTRVFTSAIYECDEYYVVWKNWTEEAEEDHLQIIRLCFTKQLLPYYLVQ